MEIKRRKDISPEYFSHSPHPRFPRRSGRWTAEPREAAGPGGCGRERGWCNRWTQLHLNAMLDVRPDLLAPSPQLREMARRAKEVLFRLVKTHHRGFLSGATARAMLIRPTVRPIISKDK